MERIFSNHLKFICIFPKLSFIRFFPPPLSWNPRNDFWESHYHGMDFCGQIAGPGLYVVDFSHNITDGLSVDNPMGGDAFFFVQRRDFFWNVCMVRIGSSAVRFRKERFPCFQRNGHRRIKTVGTRRSEEEKTYVRVIDRFVRSFFYELPDDSSG